MCWARGARDRGVNARTINQLRTLKELLLFEILAR